MENQKIINELVIIAKKQGLLVQVRKDKAVILVPKALINKTTNKNVLTYWLRSKKISLEIRGRDPQKESFTTLAQFNKSGISKEITAKKKELLRKNGF